MRSVIKWGMTTITTPHERLAFAPTGGLEADASMLGFHGKQWPDLIEVISADHATNFVRIATPVPAGTPGLSGCRFESKAGEVLFVWNV